MNGDGPLWRTLEVRRAFDAPKSIVRVGDVVAAFDAKLPLRFVTTRNAWIEFKT
jgi:hypothetical protein